MPLQRTVVDIPFLKGRDAKIDAKILPRDRLTELKNRWMDNTGALKKAPGYVAVSETTYPVNGETQDLTPSAVYDASGRVVVRAGESGTTTDAMPRLWERSGSTAIWDSLGTHVGGRFAVSGLTSLIEESGRSDWDLGTYLAVGVYENDSDVHVIVFDPESKAVLDSIGGTPFTGTPTGPRVVNVDSVFAILAQTGTNTISRATVLDEQSSSTAVSSASSLITDLHADAIYDATIGGGSSNLLLLAYKESASGHVQLRAYNNVFTQQFAVSVSEVVKGSIGCYWDAQTSRIYVYWQDNSTGNVRGQLYDSSGTPDGSAFDIDTGHTSDTLNQSTAVYDATQSAVEYFLEYRTTSGLTIDHYVYAATAGFAMKTTALAAKAFARNGRPYIWTLFAHSLQQTYILRGRDHSNYPVVGSALYRRAAPVTTDHGLCHVHTSSFADAWSSSRFADAFFCSRDDQRIDGGDIQESMILLEWHREGASLIPDAVTVADETIVGGPQVVSIQDQARPVGFPVAPYIDSVSTASGSIPAGTYNFSVIVGMQTGTGEIIRSAPSSIVSSTTGVARSFSVDVHIPPGLEGKTISLTLYRTTAEGAWYRAANAAWVEVSSSTVIPIVLTCGDVDGLITANETPYAYPDGSAGELPAAAPPPATLLAASLDKVLAVDDTDRTLIYESKPKATGIAAEFTETMAVRIPTGGEITALAVLDGRSVAFTEDSIFLLQGRGGNALGQSPLSLDGVARVASEYGCVDPRSVVTTSSGVYFRSRRGICLLDRSLQAKFVGAPVSDYTTEIVAAENDQSRNLVHFALRTGELLIRDEYHDLWMVWDTGFTTVTDIGDVQGSIYVVADSNIYSESGYNPEQNVVRTPWIRLAGLSGYQRIRRVSILGEWKASHTMTLNIYQNNDSATPTQTETLTATSSTSPYLWRVRIDNQKCDSIMFEITETGSTEGAELTGLSVELAGKGGIFRAAAGTTL